jgi:hypothetical protein
MSMARRRMHDGRRNRRGAGVAAQDDLVES